MTLRLNYRTETWIVDRAEAFAAAHPWITVEPVANSGYEKLLVLAAAGDLGDVYWASTGQGSYFELAGQGHAADLEPVARRDKYDLRQFYPHAIEQARLDGKLYALPEGIHPGGVMLYYNASLFDQAGVKAPTLDSTFDDLAEAARKVTGPNRWGIDYNRVYSFLTPTLRSFGAEWLDPPTFGKRAVFDSPRGMLAWQWLFDLTHKHRVAPVKGADQASFTDGNLAMLYGQISNNTATYPRQIGERFRVDATLIPKGPGGSRGSHAHVNMWSTHSRTKPGCSRSGSATRTRPWPAARTPTRRARARTPGTIPASPPGRCSPSSRRWSRTARARWRCRGTSRCWPWSSSRTRRSTRCGPASSRPSS